MKQKRVREQNLQKTQLLLNEHKAWLFIRQKLHLDFEPHLKKGATSFWERL